MKKRKAHMPFKITPNVHVRRDKQGIVRLLRHPQEPYVAVELVRPTPRTLASAYVHDVAEIYGIDQEMLKTISAKPGEEIQDEGSRLRLAQEKSSNNTTVVSFVQTYMGLPVWKAGLTVHMQGEPLRVTSSHSSISHELEVKKPKPDAKFMPGNDNIKTLLEDLASKVKGELIKITRTRPLIYRYDPATRVDPESKYIGRQLKTGEDSVPTLPLPMVHNTIRAEHHYTVTEVLFTLSIPRWNEVNWRAFIEVETGSVLYLRAFVTSAFGKVFTAGLFTGDEGISIDPCSPATTLDPLTTVVNLQGLTPPTNPGDPQALTGEFIEQQDTNLPNIAPPTASLPTGNFSYPADSDNFTAVNAYHLMDSCYRMVQSFGFNVGSYFAGTTFPIPVDHRGENGVVNAHHHGNATGDGTAKFRFGLIKAGCPVGNAADVRIVLHEFGHSLLRNNINSGVFGFAHGVGDSLAVILNDPGSGAADQFDTFPWTNITRRHDRDVATGWGWGGINDTGSYASTQILSTTLFRVYRSTGGDSTNILEQRFAARYLAYLIVQAVSSLDPTTPTNDPDVFATALIDADIGTLNFQGHPGGAFHKVIRWSFEKQGLYQPPGAPTPTTSSGASPDVDIYIDDGRNGEYQYLANFWNTHDIWNRLSADGGASHESPIAGVTNYLYVRVKNRGTRTANNVVVKSYRSNPTADLVWPDNWQSMTTPQLPASGPIPSGGEDIVGPFEWTPTGQDSVLASVSAVGDISNAETVNGSIQVKQLVPLDNNIGQRNFVAPLDPCEMEPCKSKRKGYLKSLAVAELAADRLKTACNRRNRWARRVVGVSAAIVALLMMLIACLPLSGPLIPSLCLVIIIAILIMLVVLANIISRWRGAIIKVEKLRSECRNAQKLATKAYMAMVDSCPKECLEYLKTVDCSC